MLFLKKRVIACSRFQESDWQGAFVFLVADSPKHPFFLNYDQSSVLRRSPCSVVEVSTSSSATSKPIEEVFTAIPEDIRRKEYQEAVAKANAEVEALASQRAREAEEAASKLKAEGKKTPSEEATANAMNEAQPSLENLLTRAKGLSTDFSWEKFSTQLAGAAVRNSDEEEPKAQIATVRGQAKAKKLAPKRAVVKPAAQKVKPTPKQPDSKPEVRPVFGGLFKQETIFVDED